MCCVRTCVFVEGETVTTGHKYTSTPFLYLLCTTTLLFQMGEGPTTSPAYTEYNYLVTNEWET